VPRIRSIKPQFWLDENLGSLPRDARLLYIGLWNLADDSGVFRWRSMQIKVQIFPYDSDVDAGQVERWLNMLVEIGDIEKVENNGQSFGVIKSFLEHQKIDRPSKQRFLEDSVKTQRTASEPATTARAKEKEKEREREEGKEKRVEPGRRPDQYEPAKRPTARVVSEQMAEITTLYEANVGRISQVVGPELNDALRTYGDEKLKEAIKETARQGKRTWRYVAGILRNWGPGDGNGLRSKAERVALENAFALACRHEKKRLGRPLTEAEQLSIKKRVSDALASGCTKVLRELTAID
jgi:DnaD/phage-associated family protein